MHTSVDHQSGWRTGSPSGISKTTQVERALLQRRVANLGLVLTGIGAAFIVMRVIAVFGVGRPERLWSLSMLSHYAGVAISTTMWLVCRKGSHTAGRILTIEFVGLLSVCAAYTVMAVDIPQAFRPEMTILLAFGVFLLGHAVHVPSTWHWTAVLGTALAAPLFLGSWMILTPMDPRIVAASADAQGSVQTSEASIIGIGMASVVTWWVVIVGTAASASAVIYGLRREVRAARQLGQYTLDEKLGEGAMGVVYRAHHAMLRRATAVKLLQPGRFDEASLERFEREVQATAQLSHPNTVRVFDYGRTADGLFYYVMELLNGATLEEIVETNGPMPPARVAHVLRQITSALVEAHGLGLIHRDIKATNVVLTNRGGAHDHVTVVDFGLVKDLDAEESTGLSTVGTIVGTPAYLAPEVIRGQGQDGVGRDLYALGCLAYFLLTGGDVFVAKTTIEVCVQHLDEQPEPPSRRLGERLPPQLEQLVLELLAKSVDDRPSSALALMDRLEQLDGVGAWTRNDASGWWDGPGRAIADRTRASPNAKGTDASFAVDPRGRGEPSRDPEAA